MATDTGPATRQIRAGVPAHRKAQGQAIADDDLGIARCGADAVRRGSVNGAGREHARRCVQQHVELVRDVQVGALQRAREGDDERCVCRALRAQRAQLLRRCVHVIFIAVGVGRAAR